MATKTNTTINGQNYYRITRTIGHTVEDGVEKPIKKQFYGSSKGDAEAQYKAWLNEQARLKYEKEWQHDHSTLHDRAKQFIETSLEPSAKYAEGTKIRYKSAYNVHINGTWLDKMCVKDIHASEIQRFYNELDVSDSVIKGINKFMSAFYKWMARNDYADNMVAAVDLPVKEKNSRQNGIVIWDDNTWKALTSRKFDFRHDFLIKTLSYTGMRIGEALALKYGDIEDNVIHVTKQYNLGEIKSPKYDSVRDIPMHPKLIKAFKKHRKWHEAEMQKNGYQTDFIFTTSTGGLLEIKNLHRAFDRFYEREKLPRQTFKTYRSTFCTKLCEAGVPLEVASKILGHKSLEVTAAHYALVRQDTKKDAIALLK